MKLSLLYEDIDAKTQLLLKKYYNNDQTKIKQIELAKAADPTNNKKYLDWITKLLTKEIIRLPEDTEKLSETLTQFEKTKNRGDFTDQKDINKYNSYGELARTLDKYTEESKRQTKIKTGRGLLVPENAEIIYQDNTYTIAKITDVETAIKASTRTKWCTANPEPAERYLSEGPLYVVYKDGERYALVHYESAQVKDVHDSDFSSSKEKELYDIINKADNRQYSTKFLVKYITTINKRMPDLEPEIILDPIAAANYAFQVRGRWPEAEQIILTNRYATKIYLDLLNWKWPEAEDYIIKHYPYVAAQWATENKRKWPEAEPYIIKDPSAAYFYAHNVIKNSQQ